MSNREPYPASDAIVGIAFGIILTIVTCGIYGLIWQYKQMAVLNAWLGRDDFSFGVWLLLSIVTCGVFAVYYEYKMAKGIIEIQEDNQMRVSNDLPLICVVLSLFGLSLVSLAIQQSEINKFYNETSD